LINRLLAAFGYERRSLAQPSSDLLALLGVHPTASGIWVSPETALRSPTCLACITSIAQTIGSLPLHLFRRAEAGGRERDRSHPAARLLAGDWAPWSSGVETRTALMVDALLYGHAFGQLVRVNGESAEIHRLSPHAVAVEYDEATTEPSFRIHQARGDDRIVPWQDMLYLATPGSAPGRLLNLTRLAREGIALELVMELHEARLFGSGARPSGVLKVPGQLSQQAGDRLRQSWDSAHGGGANSGRTAILESGTEFEALQFSSVDTQFAELRRLAIQQIASAYRVPLPLVGDLTRAVFTNVTELNRQYVQLTLLPWAEALKAALERVLLAPEERGDIYIELVFEDLLRGDIKTRADALRLAVGGAWLTANEARRGEDLPAIAGGDELILQAGQQAGSAADAAA
jgi:HK97 family phage portal protein